jgi:transcription initiation factor TFIIE subunit alpha
MEIDKPISRCDPLTTIEELIHRAYLNKLVGEDGLRIVESIPGEEITDERLAELTGISLNTVRRTLYLLYEHRLAIYRRKRDPDSGWLTYLLCLHGRMCQVRLRRGQ